MLVHTSTPQELKKSSQSDGHQSGEISHRCQPTNLTASLARSFWDQRSLAVSHRTTDDENGRGKGRTDAADADGGREKMHECRLSPFLPHLTDSSDGCGVQRGKGEGINFRPTAVIVPLSLPFLSTLTRSPARYHIHTLLVSVY